MMKLVKDLSARTYELTYLVPSSLSETEVSNLKDKIAQLIARYKGKLVVAEDWGKKNLAYAIRFKSQPQTQAHYTHMSIEMGSDQAVAFEKEIYLDTNIMRHLFVKVGDVVASETTAKTEEKSQAAEKPKTSKKVASKAAKKE